MAFVDKLTPAMRRLVHEYGAVIVSNMITEGHRNASALKPILETWRSRRQQEWLSTNYISTRNSRSMQRIYERALGNGEGR
jgi:hypothetical protein